MGSRIRFAALVLFSAALASGPVQRISAEDHKTANPEDGSIVDGVYVNPYFGLRYALPTGWQAGPLPARPSYGGYYVLNTPAPPEDAKTTILLAAQDTFFAAAPIATAVEFVNDLAQSTAGADSTTLDPSMVTIADRPFARLEIRGSPLSRIVLATDIRCHVVIFTFTGAEPGRLQDLERSLAQLSLLADEPVASCVKGYATAETILRKVNPVSVGPQFLRFPIRIVIGADGRVKHIHVIRAFPEQRKSIEDALAQWEFEPYRVDGHPAELETGLVFEFKPENLQR